MRNATVKTPVALVLAVALILRATPAAAAAPDLSETRRRFVAAVRSSDQAVAAAEAAFEAAIAKGAVLTSADAKRSVEAMAKILRALKDFKAEKQRLLAGDLGTHESLMRRAAEFARACDVLAKVIQVEIAVIVVVVAVVASIATGGPALFFALAVVVAVAAVVSAAATIMRSIPDLLRVLGFREAGDSTERWMKDNPWFGTTLTAIQVVAAVISTSAVALLSLRAAEAAARDAQARLDAAVKAAPAPPAPAPNVGAVAGPPKQLVEKVATTFEGDVGASFHVTLENGQATKTVLAVSLHGTVAIASRANPARRFTLEGDATLTAGGGGWASLRGQGTLRSGGWAMSSSTLTIEGGSISGGGTLAAWGKSFAMSYSASGDVLAARGSLSGADTPWKRLPGLEAEWRIEAPKIEMKLDGATLSPTFGARKVSVRTVAIGKNGVPWSSASATPGTVFLPAPPSPGIPVPFPNLPAPADAEKAARDACRAAASKIPEKSARDAALAVCDANHPAPPAIPSLPSTVTLKVAEIFP